MMSSQSMLLQEDLGRQIENKIKDQKKVCYMIDKGEGKLIMWVGTDYSAFNFLILLHLQNYHKTQILC